MAGCGASLGRDGVQGRCGGRRARRIHRSAESKRASELLVGCAWMLRGEGEDMLGGVRVEEARFTRPDRQMRVRGEVLARAPLVPAGECVAEVERGPLGDRDGQDEPVNDLAVPSSLPDLTNHLS